MKPEQLELRETMAREYVETLLGKEPEQFGIVEGIMAFIATTAVPATGIQLFGDPYSNYEWPIIISGLAFGFATYFYLKRKQDRWHKLYSEKLIELSREDESNKPRQHS